MIFITRHPYVFNNDDCELLQPDLPSYPTIPGYIASSGHLKRSDYPGDPVILRGRVSLGIWTYCAGVVFKFEPFIRDRDPRKI